MLKAGTGSLQRADRLGSAQTLRWPTQAVQKGDSKGVSYVELVANYVAVTKLIPPAGLDDVQIGAARDIADRPRSLCNITMCFTDALRQLERISRL